jgi:CRISPR system Cascade subunit CasE
MTQAFLTRVKLKRDPAIAALGAVLLPDDDDRRLDVNHRLVWSLFADDAEATRDFLWREEAPGRLILLSRRPPPMASPVLDVIDSQAFDAAPAANARLAFALRANPTIALARHGAKKNGKRQSGQPVDVVMHALHATPGRRGPDGTLREPLKRGEGRAFVRDALLGWSEAEGADPRRPALDWLERQGAAKGFAIDRAATSVRAYRRARTSRGPGKPPAVFGVVDFEGVLTVRDAETFRASLLAGFGRAKAFGCGLMLVAWA